MKITRIKFYQAVSVWNGTKFELMTHLNLSPDNKGPAYEMDLLDGVGVIVRGRGGNSTIITMNNIAFMTVDETVEKPKAVKKA